MKASSFLQDFKAFAMKGNVIDMAVGVIIGGAFGKIVSSIVADIIMPVVGLLVGGVNFADLKLVLKPAEVVDGVEKAAVTLNYGNFLQVTFDFVVMHIPGHTRSLSGSILRHKISLKSAILYPFIP